MDKNHTRTPLNNTQNGWQRKSLSYIFLCVVLISLIIYLSKPSLNGEQVRDDAKPRLVKRQILDTFRTGVDRFKVFIENLI